jgi:hypothetical protein
MRNTIPIYTCGFAKVNNGVHMIGINGYCPVCKLKLEEEL